MAADAADDGGADETTMVDLRRDRPSVGDELAVVAQTTSTKAHLVRDDDATRE